MPHDPTDDLDLELEADDLTNLERRLGGWRPASGGLDRGRMLYEAGRVSAAADGRRAVRSLAALSLALATAVAGLATAWNRERSRGEALQAELVAIRLDAATRPGSSPGPSLAREAPASDGPARPRDPFSYLEMTRRIVDGRLNLEWPAAWSRADRRPAERPEPSPIRVGDRDRLLDL